MQKTLSFEREWYEDDRSPVQIAENAHTFRTQKELFGRLMCALTRPRRDYTMQQAIDFLVRNTPEGRDFLSDHVFVSRGYCYASNAHVLLAFAAANTPDGKYTFDPFERVDAVPTELAGNLENIIRNAVETAVRPAGSPWGETWEPSATIGKRGVHHVVKIGGHTFLQRYVSLALLGEQSAQVTVSADPKQPLLVRGSAHVGAVMPLDDDSKDDMETLDDPIPF